MFGAIGDVLHGAEVEPRGDRSSPTLRQRGRIHTHTCPQGALPCCVDRRSRRPRCARDPGRRCSQSRPDRPLRRRPIPRSNPTSGWSSGSSGFTRIPWDIAFTPDGDGPSSPSGTAARSPSGKPDGTTPDAHRGHERSEHRRVKAGSWASSSIPTSIGTAGSTPARPRRPTCEVDRLDGGRRLHQRRLSRRRPAGRRHRPDLRTPLRLSPALRLGGLPLWIATGDAALPAVARHRTSDSLAGKVLAGRTRRRGQRRPGEPVHRPCRATTGSTATAIATRRGWTAVPCTNQMWTRRARTEASTTRST